MRTLSLARTAATADRRLSRRARIASSTPQVAPVQGRRLGIITGPVDEQSGPVALDSGRVSENTGCPGAFSGSVSEHTGPFGLLSRPAGLPGDPMNEQAGRVGAMARPFDASRGNLTTQGRLVIETAERAVERDDPTAVRARIAAQRGARPRSDTARAAVAVRTHDLHAP